MLYQLTSDFKQNFKGDTTTTGYLSLYYLNTLALGVIVGTSWIAYKIIPYGENADKKTYANTNAIKQTIFYVLLATFQGAYMIGLALNDPSAHN